MAVSECAEVVPAGHYSAILRRNPSTSSRMFGEKNFGNSVDDGVSDNGGMCCKAFLGERQHKQNSQNSKYGEKQTQYIRTDIVVLQQWLLLCAEKDSLSQCRVRLH